VSDEKAPFVLSINQMVAWNIAKAREAKGWTQAKVVGLLAPYLGEEWSVATYSAAERSFARADRVRQFTADDLVAFAAVFGVPVQYFFRPIIATRDHVELRLVAGDPAVSHQFAIPEYVRVTYGSASAIDDLLHDLQDLIDQSPDQWEDGDAKAIGNAITVFSRARVKASKEDLGKMQESLESVASFLRSLSKTANESPNDERDSDKSVG
jgi:transcriptional regulator with XRE-family HTH domain